jgi:hypothetical protein
MKLKNALGLISEKYKEPSVCESCGEQFTCGATLKGCWCMKIEILDEARAAMKARFSQCLCPQCLGNFASGPAIVVKYPDGKTEVIGGAVRVDTQNFHEGMFDFYDESGTLLRQIDMGSGISWEDAGASPQ